MRANARLQAELTSRLADAGFLEAEREAAELLAHADDDAALDTMIRRRLAGEPLAWISGSTRFCGARVNVAPGVYVPRWHTEALTRRAVARLPADGVAVDMCTGSGAIAAVLRRERPRARVVATDLDPVAVACARSNGVEAYLGDLTAPLPSDLQSRVDVLIAVVPYVPTAALSLLQRDTFAFETSLSYDGGCDGTDLLRRLAREARRFLRANATLLLELGGDQGEPMRELLGALGYAGISIHEDEDGHPRGVEAVRPTA
jgi:release factor glutamine methyltransferase